MQEVYCALAFFSKFITPNHINQNVSGVWESSLEEPLSVALVGYKGGSGECRKWSTRKVTSPRPVRNTVSLHCKEPLLNADSVLPVGVVLDPSVRVVM